MRQYIARLIAAATHFTIEDEGYEQDAATLATARKYIAA